MKKIPAIILLTLGNLAAVYILSVLIMLLWWGTFSIGLAVVAGFLALAALGFASSLIYNKFKKKYGLKPSRFILAAYLPLAAVSFINVIVIIILDNLHFFNSFLGGLGEFISSLFFAAVAVLYLSFGSCFTLNHAEEKDETKGTLPNEQQN